eukprot:6477153-Amphidinium_carterae.1
MWRIIPVPSTREEVTQPCGICKIRVLPDWRPKQSCKRGSPDVGATDALKKLDLFLQEKGEEEDESKADQRESKGPRRANADFLLALDHMLFSGTGRGLKAFECKQPPVPLLREERRYWVAMTPGRTRACVKNTLTGGKRYEVPIIADEHGRPERAALHVVSDEGSVGRVALLWLMSKTKIRGSAWVDPLHRHWNDTRLAMKGCSLWSVVQEYTCVFNVHMAPWQQSAFHSIISEAGHEFFRTCDESNNLYMHMYEQLALEQGCSPIDWATKEHVASVWNSLRNSKHLHAEGDHVKLGRWYSFFKEADARSDRLAELQLILLYIGVQQGWWKDYESSPLGSRQMKQDDFLVRDGAVASAGSKNRAVAVSNEQEDLKQMRSSCRNSLEVVTKILANTYRRRLLQCMTAAVRPFRECFQRLQTTLKTRRGRGESMVSWASGKEISQVCSVALASMQCSRTMHALRMRTEGASEMMEAEVSEEMEVASQYFRVVIAMIGQHLQSSLTYSHSLPGMLALLLSKEPGVRREQLGELKRLWEWLMEKEQRSLEHPHLAAFLEDLQFTRWVWVREVATQLWESNFDSVPTETEEALHMCFFGGVVSTNIIEDSFNELKRLGSQSANRKLRRQRRYHGLQCCTLQSDYDLPAPPPSVQQPTTTSLPSNIFEGDVKTFSMEKSFLDEFMASSWQSPSPGKWSLIPMALQAYFQQNDWQLLQNNWMTLLLDEGCLLVHHAAPTKGKLVLKVTKYGALTWPLERTTQGSEEYYVPQLQTSGKPLWSFEFVNNLQDWKATTLVPMPPCSQPLHEGLACGIKLRLSSKCVRLAVFAAESCFKNLLVPHLRSLWQSLGRPLADTSDKPPKTEQDFCQALLEAVLPKNSTEERAAILAKRCRLADATASSSVLFEGDNLEMIAGVLDESDKVEFEDSKSKHQKSKGNSTSSKGMSDGLQVADAKNLVKKKISLKGGHTPESVKKFLPRNFRIALDSNRHRRWQMEDVLKRGKPSSYSKAYGDESVVTRQEALYMVLEKAWEWHTHHTGELCPWSFATTE